MTIIPRYGNGSRQVEARPVAGRKINLQTSTAMFGGLEAQQNARNAEEQFRTGTALQKMGESLGKQAGSQLDKQNRARALDLEQKARQELNSFLYDPQQGILTKKGADALGSQALMSTKIDEVRQKYMGMNDPQDVKDMLGSAFSQFETSYGGIAERHAFGQLQNYEQNALDALISNSQEDIALNFLDEDKFNENLEEQFKAIEVKYAGQAPGVITAAKREAKSTSRAAQITSMINTDRPFNIIMAKKEFEAARQRGDLTFDATMKLERALNSAVPKAAATLEMDRLRSASTLEGTDGAQVFEAMIQQESGGRQLDNGAPLTSSKGAIGIAQVMPATAREIAQEMGVEFDEFKYATDADYNKMLGKAYFDKQLAEFGSPTLAAMAYNAGPGAVKDFMNGTNKTGKNPKGLKIGDPMKDEVTLDQFVAQFPFKETRDYVAKVSGYAGADGGIRTADLENSIDRLNKIHPDAGGELLAMYEAGVKRQNALQKVQKDEFENRILQFVTENNGDWTQIPASMRAEAAKLGIDVTAYKGTDDPQAVIELEGMNTEELEYADLSEYKQRLRFDTYQSYLQKQAKLQQPEERNLKKQVDSAVEYYMATQQYDTTGDSKQINARKASITQYIEGQIELYKTANNDKLPDLKMIHGYAAAWHEINSRPGYLYGRSEGILNAFDDIPETKREEIAQALISRGISPSEQTIITVYQYEQSRTK